jgi:hypothetical protein
MNLSVIRRYIFPDTMEVRIGGDKFCYIILKTYGGRESTALLFLISALHGLE